MRGNHEPKLCLDCPLSYAWKQEALKRLRNKQYTREVVEPTPLRECLERRKILSDLGSKCPYFPESESLPYHTDRTFKQRLDRKNANLKKQNLQTFL